MTVTLHVLLLEDEDAHAELILRAFKSRGGTFRVTVAGSVQEARDCLTQTPPDLLVADLLLPDGRGTDLLPGAEEDSVFPVVIMTSYGDEKAAVEAMKAGALDYVVKSEVTLADMPHIAERVMRQWDDISERKRVAKALERSEQRFRSYFEMGVVGMAITSPGRGWLEVNTRLCEIVGYSRAELLKKTWDELTHPDDLPQSLAQFDRVLGGELDGYSMEKRFLHKQGRIVHVSDSLRCLRGSDGSVSYLVQLVQDITQRKRAEKSLRQSEQRYRLVTEFASDCIYWQGPEGEVFYISPACEELTGYNPDEFRESPTLFDQIVYSEDQLIWSRCQPDDSPLTRPRVSEFRIVTKYGEVRCVDHVCRPVYSDDGEFLGVRGSYSDVTDRKRAEDQLHKAHDELEQRVKDRTADLQKANDALADDVARRKRVEEVLQAKQRLLGELLDLQERDRKLVAYEIHDGLAQQLAGALMSFQAFGELNKHDPDRAESVFDQGLQLVTDGLAEARRMIDGLRPPVLDDAGVVEAVRHLAREAEQEGGPDVEFFSDVHFSRLAPPLENAVFRIVQEGLTNACRHSKSSRVEVRLVQRGKQVEVEVQDWGVGFDPENVPQNSFGLQGIRERATLLGGHATISAAPHKGTRIRVELPVLERTS